MIAAFVCASVQLSYTAYASDDFVDSRGLQTELDSSDSLVARFGVRFDVAVVLQRCVLQPFVTLDFLNEFRGDNRVLVNDTAFDTSMSGFSGGASSGLDASFGSHFRLYVDARYRSGQRVDDVYTGQLGLQYIW